MRMLPRSEAAAVVFVPQSAAAYKWWWWWLMMMMMTSQIRRPLLPADDCARRCLQSTPGMIQTKRTQRRGGGRCY